MFTLLCLLLLFACFYCCLFVRFGVCVRCLFLRGRGFRILFGILLLLLVCLLVRFDFGLLGC